jgi:hypothetical protein
MLAGVDPAQAAVLAGYQKYGDPAAAYERRQARKALGLDLRRNRDIRVAARAGLLPGHAYDRAEAARLRGQGPAVQAAAGPASLADLLGVKGGPAGGKPVVGNLSNDQRFMDADTGQAISAFTPTLPHPAPNNLAALLALHGPRQAPRKGRYPSTLRPFL